MVAWVFGRQWEWVVVRVQPIVWLVCNGCMLFFSLCRQTLSWSDLI